MSTCIPCGAFRGMVGSLWNLGLAGILLAASGLGALAADTKVANPAELARAIKASKPGDVLVMADGPWRDVAIDFNANGDELRPITLRAESPGKVVLSGSSLLKIGGKHLVVDGLLFNGEATTPKTVVEFRHDSRNLASHCRLTNCAIVDYNPPDKELETHWVSLYGEENRVDHCYFAGKTNGGTTLVVWVGDQPNRHSIDLNHFGPRPKLGANGGETIRVGDSKSSMRNSRTLVENNYFEKCDGEIEAISNKSCENIYRGNTFVACSATLCLRHGNRCLVEGNYFLGHRTRGSGGVRVIGEGHRVINNYFEGLEGDGSRSALSMMNGQVDSPLNGYFQVKNAVIAFNTFVDNQSNFAIGLGEGRENTLPPRDCLIANNVVVGSRAPLIHVSSSPIGLKWAGNIMSGADLGIPVSPGITVSDPKLIRGEGGLWRPSGTSPALGAAMGEFAFVREDIDGQARSGKLDVGCDQHSEQPILRHPLTTDLVGPPWLRRDPRGARAGRPRAAGLAHPLPRPLGVARVDSAP
jgi:poly(beta-D-mannuronate) lyase